MKRRDDAVTLAMSPTEAAVMLGFLIKLRYGIEAAPAGTIRVLDDQIGRIWFQLRLARRFNEPG